MFSYRKTFIAATLLLLYTACVNNAERASNAPKRDSLEIMTRPFESASEIKIIKGDHNLIETEEARQRTTVFIHQMKGYGQDTTFARQAATVLEKVINSDDLKNTVINNTYREDEGFSPQQIYDLIMTAHEPVGPGGKDYVMDLYLRVITEKEDGREWIENCEPGSSEGTIGIDGAGSGIAAVCPQWLRSTAEKRKPSWLAAHFIHEYMHVLSFRHNRNKPKSVPYKIQAIVEQLGAQYDPR